MSSKVIVITGASRGIGLAIAKFLSASSSPTYKLFLVARSLAPLEALRDQAPDSVEVASVDMGEVGAGKEVIEEALKRFGRLDSLVINHGVLDPVKKVADGSIEEWKIAFDINFFSAVEMVRTICTFDEVVVI